MICVIILGGLNQDHFVIQYLVWSSCKDYHNGFGLNLNNDIYLNVILLPTVLAVNLMWYLVLLFGWFIALMLHIRVILEDIWTIVSSHPWQMFGSRILSEAAGLMYAFLLQMIFMLVKSCCIIMGQQMNTCSGDGYVCFDIHFLSVCMAFLLNRNYYFPCSCSFEKKFMNNIYSHHSVIS